MSEPSTYCGLCGTRNPVAAIVCIKCGALLAAYQATPDAPAAAEQPTPAPASTAKPADVIATAQSASDSTPKEPGGAAAELFGQGEIILKPIQFEPFDFETVKAESAPTVASGPTIEPIDVEFRPKSNPEPATPPPPKTEAPRPVAVRVEPTPSDGPPISPGFEQMFGGRPPSSRFYVLSLGRRPRQVMLASVLLLIVSCVVITTARGVWASLAFCFMTLALIGMFAALIIWMRRKIDAKK